MTKKITHQINHATTLLIAVTLFLSPVTPAVAQTSSDTPFSASQIEKPPELQPTESNPTKTLDQKQEEQLQQILDAGSTPIAPTRFTASAGDNQITLSWDAHPESDVTRFKLYPRIRKSLANASPSDAPSDSDTNTTNPAQDALTSPTGELRPADNKKLSTAESLERTDITEPYTYQTLDPILIGVGPRDESGNHDISHPDRHSALTTEPTTNSDQHGTDPVNTTLDPTTGNITVAAETTTTRHKFTLTPDLLPKLANNSTLAFSLTAIDTGGNESPRTYEIETTPTAPEPDVRDMRISAWMPTNWDIEDARKSFTGNLDLYHTISFFWYNAEADGSLSTKGNARDPELIQLAHDHNIKVIPTITNNYNAQKVSDILRDPGVLQSHIDTIVSEVTAHNYDGIDIDYEGVDTDDRELFTAFARALKSALRAQSPSLELIITVQPKKSDRDNWNGPGAMDYTELGQIADRVRVMTYDNHRENTDPGPIAPTPWMHQVLDYTKSHIDPNKIETGIPFYGYTWCEDDSSKNSAVVSDGITKIRADHADQNLEAAEQWNQVAEEPHFTYLDDNCEFITYFQNTRSIKAKLQVALNQQIGGISIWRLGSEDPAFFDQIREQFALLPKAPINTTITPRNNEIQLTWNAPESDTSTTGYKVYYGYNPGDYGEVEDVGLTTSHKLSGLTNDRPVYITINAYDKNGNTSRRPGEFLATPRNELLPSTIEDLQITATYEYSVDLQWTAPADDESTGARVSSYEIRTAPFEITTHNWDKATKYPSAPQPKAPGEIQDYQIRELDSDVSYYFAIRATDEAGNQSFVGQNATSTTLDVLAPSTPTITSHTVNDQQINLQISDLPSDEDFSGIHIITTNAGTHESHQQFFPAKAIKNNTATINHLSNNTIYNFQIRSIDDKGNQSEPTQTLTATPYDTTNTNPQNTSRLTAILLPLSLATTITNHLPNPQNLKIKGITKLLENR